MQLGSVAVNQSRAWDRRSGIKKAVCRSVIQPVVAQDRAGGEFIAVCHHQTCGQDADRTFKNAHVLVHLEGDDALGLQQAGGSGHAHGIIAAKKLFHGRDVKPRLRNCRWHGNAGPQIRDYAMTLQENVRKPLDRLSEALSDEMGAVNALIRDRMASRHAPRIPEVTAHLIEAGGKRLRPMLTLAAAKMVGYGGPYHIHLAATVEFIHTATLLHDDVVDESSQRRGRPTANLLWDNKSSVLVGDYLFARSFQLMVEPGNMRTLEILANASATIAEGEVLQLTAAQDLATTEDIYIQVVRGKTAALFSAATEVGGVIADAPADQVQALFDYGDALGIAFQIVDDLLDYGGATETIGKNVGDDFRERKLTLPVIKAVAKADAEERAFWSRTIEKGDQRDGDLEQALALLARHGAMDAARNDALAWTAKAKTALQTLPEHPIRDMLTDLADFVVSRVT